MKTHVSKFRKTIPALALICHLADSDHGGPISSSAMLRAIAWSDFLMSHARRVYGSGSTMERDAAERIAGKIREGKLSGAFTARQVKRPAWSGLTDKKIIDAAIEILVECGWLIPAKVETRGRWTEEYRPNPKAFK